MATLEAKYIFDMKNYAEVGENVIVSEDGDILTKRFVESSYGGALFDEIAEPSDAGVEIEVDDAVYEEAEQLAELIQSVVDVYEKNPPKTFEEDLDYEFNDDDPNEWVQFYEK